MDDLNSADPAALYQAAGSAMRVGEPAEAERSVRRLLELDPHHGDGLNRVGILAIQPAHRGRGLVRAGRGGGWPMCT